MLFDKKNDAETVKRKCARLINLRNQQETVKLRLNELDTTRVATLNYDNNVAGALAAQQRRDAVVALLRSEQNQLTLEIGRLQTELDASKVPCPNFPDHELFPFQIKHHLAEARKLSDPTKCAVLM
jgi:hypothetical protein